MTNRVGKVFSCFAPCTSGGDSPPPSEHSSPPSTPRSSSSSSSDLSPRKRPPPLPMTPDERPGSPHSKFIRAAMDRPRQTLALRSRVSGLNVFSTVDSHLRLRYSPPHAMTIESSLIRRPPSLRVEGSAEDFRAAIATDAWDRSQKKNYVLTHGPYQVRSNGFEEVAAPRMLPREQQELVGLARWPDPAYNREDEDDQKRFANYFHAFVHDAGARLRGGQIAEFDQLWLYAREARAFIAVAMVDPPPELTPDNIGAALTYGIVLNDAYRHVDPRGDDRHRLNTEVTECYAYITSRLDGIKAATIKAKDNRLGGLEGLDIKMHGLTAELFGTRQPLTLIAYPIDKRGNKRPSPAAHIYHPIQNTSDLIMRHVRSRLFEDVMAQPHSIEDLVPKLAEMHFWLAHAIPDNRGSAAKSEMVVRAIAAAHGFDLPPFKRGFVPDMEAFVTPKRRYIEQYALALEDSDLLRDMQGGSRRDSGEAGPSSSGGGY